MVDQRFEGCNYTVEDHPYDRGYWDEMLGHVEDGCVLEPDAGMQREYQAGREVAKAELADELRKLIVKGQGR